MVRGSTALGGRNRMIVLPTVAPGEPIPRATGWAAAPGQRLSGRQMVQGLERPLRGGRGLEHPPAGFGNEKALKIGWMRA